MTVDPSGYGAVLEAIRGSTLVHHRVGEYGYLSWTGALATSH